MIELNEENFDVLMAKENSAYVIKFFSPTCGPCHTMSPVVDKLDQENPKLNIYEVNTAFSPRLASHFGIRGVPSILFCEGESVLFQVSGVTPFGNLQYIINNLDNPTFRATGKFPEPEGQKKTNLYFGVAILLLAVFYVLALFVF